MRIADELTRVFDSISVADLPVLQLVFDEKAGTVPTAGAEERAFAMPVRAGIRQMGTIQPTTTGRSSTPLGKDRFEVATEFYTSRAETIDNSTSNSQ